MFKIILAADSTVSKLEMLFQHDIKMIHIPNLFSDNFSLLTDMFELLKCQRDIARFNN